MFTNNDSYDLVNNQPLMWVAEYDDQTFLSEFDLSTGTNNDMKDIQIDRLIRFGLVGEQTKMYFEVYSGIFKIMGLMIQANYKIGERSYPLIGLPEYYQKINQFKNAEFYVNNETEVIQNVIPTITQFNFGYQKETKIEDTTLIFEVTCEILNTGILQIHFKFNTSKDIDGNLEFFKNGQLMDSIYMPIKANLGGESIWIMR